MKIMRNIIVVLVGLALIVGVIIYNDRKPSSITIVKINIGFVGAKEIKDPENIQAICDAFNSIKYKKIEESEMIAYFGSDSYLFILKYASGSIKEILYTDGHYLKSEDEYYQIYSKEFDDFWNLDYPIKDWHFNEDGSYDVNQ